MIKIKLAILDSDENYLLRISSVFNNKLADKVELYTFTDIDIAMDVIVRKRIDVFVAGEEFDINTARLPEECAFAFLTQAKDIDTYKGERVIAKYQRADLIYKQALSLYSEKATNISGIKFDDTDTMITSFFSCGGGAGASTIAAACAVNLAQSAKVIYLNLDPLGDVSCFFSGEGQFDISDVIYAIKSKRSNLTLKLESTVKSDTSNVMFYDSSKSAFDMTELDTDDIKTLINGLKIVGSYDYIIIDAQFSLDDKSIEIMDQSNKIVFVSDGSRISNSKWSRLYEALTIIEERKNKKILSKLFMIYNKFSDRTSSIIENDAVQVLGGVPRFKNGDVMQIVKEVASMRIFDNLS